MGSPDMQNLFANRGMILQAKAFHRAVFDGRPDCLKELVRWAQNHNHDFTELRNVEELDILKGTEKGLTCSCASAWQFLFWSLYWSLLGLCAP